MPTTRRTLRLLLPIALVALAVPSLGRAHFLLRAPASWQSQDGLGSPQKLGPCGNEPGGAPTGVVTTFTKGETITVTIDETVFHPGHYRVALAVHDRSELPPEPPVTPGTTQCGSVPVTNPAVFPVLVDGALPHTNAFGSPQSIQVTLPADVTCDHCTLQILEFMSSHGAPCFYHHCADIAIHASTGGPCTNDGECGDGDACTVDTCNQTTLTCDAPAAINCDDGDACTRDRCDASDGCRSQPFTIFDVTPGFLGAFPDATCIADRVPSVIARRFRQAGAFLVRAARPSAKVDRYLRLAARRLERAAARLVRSTTLSSTCHTAIDALLTRASAEVVCLQAQ